MPTKLKKRFVYAKGLESFINGDGKTKLKQLPDNAKFKLSQNSKVVYQLHKLDEKKKMATYSSLKSNRTFTKGWAKEVWVCGS